MRSKSLSLLSLVAASVLSGAAFATDFSTPSSLLLFPEYRTTMGHQTFITVTNTNTAGSVLLHYIYINSTDCSEFDTQHLLTANDTLTVSAALDNAGFVQGYLYVFAENVNGRAISFNWLTGSAIVFETNPTGPGRFTTFASRPYGYKAIVTTDNALTIATDDQFRDLNGIEYEKTANNLLFPLFFGQDPANAVTSSIVLVNLTGGALFNVHVGFTVYDDSEHQFSADTTFNCWVKVPLSAFTQHVFNTDFLAMQSGHATSINGFPGFNVQTGWMRVHADIANPITGGGGPIANPAIVAVLDQQINALSDAETPYLLDLTNANGHLFSIP